MTSNSEIAGEKIAIIGMACRFPGACNVKEYWNNLISGTESVRTFTKKQAVAWGAKETDVRNTNYICAGGVLDNIYHFDPVFFGFSETEAKLMDPQQRLFLECAYEAMEDAGQPQADEDIITGVFSASSTSSYLYENLLRNHNISKMYDFYYLESYNNKDYMPSRLAYKMNLKGPCMAVQSGCLSSYSAIYTAIQSLFAYECDCAVVGGTSVRQYVNRGYFHQEGGDLSSDGHCRPLDERANGTVGGNGVGVVVLKRLEDAVKDNNKIYCVISGIGLTNDGSNKVGFNSPGFYGQLESISTALLNAGLSADQIDYIEVQGAATKMVDDMELSVLQTAFEESKRKCFLGCVKANIGNLDVAAGMAAIIKVSLMAKYKIIPPQINICTPNSFLHTSNFLINTALVDQKQKKSVHMAINAFGVGGNNCHMVVESYEGGGTGAFDEGETTVPRQDYCRRIYAVYPDKGTGIKAEENYDLYAVLSEYSGFPVGQDTKISELNLNSLMTIQLLTKLQTLYGISISVEKFLSIDKVESLEHLVNTGHLLDGSEENKKELSSIYKIREGNSGIMIICVAPVSAISDKYVMNLFRPLTESVPENISMYNLKLNVSYKDDLENYLKRSVEQIISIWNDSENVILIGWCTGGLVAHEIARVLEKKGKKPKHIFMLNTYEPSYAKKFTEKKFVFEEREIQYSQIIHFIDQMDVRKVNDRSCVEKELSELCEKSSVWDFIWSKLCCLDMSQRMLKRIFKADIDLTAKINAESERLCLQYKNHEFCDHTTLVIPESFQYSDVDQYLGWKHFCCGNIDIQYSKDMRADMLTYNNALELVNAMNELRIIGDQP